MQIYTEFTFDNIHQEIYTKRISRLNKYIQCNTLLLKPFQYLTAIFLFSVQKFFSAKLNNCSRKFLTILK